MVNKNSKRVSIWLVGGGTGGHIMPLLAVAESLERHTHVRLTFLGEAGGREEALAKQAGLPFKAIKVGKLRRYWGFKAVFLNIRDLFRVAIGIRQSIKLIHRQRPQIIFCKGGPVSLPVAIAAHWTKTPLATHESDIVMGLSNRLISRWAQVVFTAFPADAYPLNLADKIVAVGLPLRRQFFHRIKGRKSHRPMVLVMAGIQGSLAINEALAAILPELLTKSSVMHITGDLSFDRFRSIKESLPPELAEYYAVVNFAANIAEFMAEATLVVSRASSAIFEIATVGKAMLLIPLPTAANNHQVMNAEYFVSHQAATILRQENMTPVMLLSMIESLLDDRVARSELEKHARAFASAEAADKIAERLLSACQ